MAKHFKVYIKWDNDSRPDIYRFDIVGPNYGALVNVINDRAPELNNSYKIYWQDAEEDFVVIANNEDLETCLQSQRRYGMMPNDIKLEVRPKKLPTSIAAPMASAVQPPHIGDTVRPDEVVKAHHLGVVCDICDGPVIGFRYKCLTCEDFDLCEDCEGKRMHPEHCILRLPEPLISRHLMKTALKRSWHIFKNVPLAEDGGHCHKKKRDRSGERKHHHHHGDHHDKHDHHREKRDHHREKREHHHEKREHHHRDRSERREYRRQRGTWLDTFTNYMNQFANLAGDMECSLNTETGANVPRNTPHANTGANTGANTPRTTEPNASAQNPAEILIHKIISPENVKGLFELQKTLHEILIPQPPKADIPKDNQYDNSAVDVDMENEPVPAATAAAEVIAEISKAPEVTQEKNVNENAEVTVVNEKDAQAKETPEKVTTPITTEGVQPSTSAPTFKQVQIQEFSKDKLMQLHKKLATILAEAQLEQMAKEKLAKPAGDEKNDVEMAKGDDNDSSSDSSSSDAGSERGDDWTLINKDVNEYVVDGSSASAPSAPQEPAPIGFNLPKEFSERVQISGQSLYPPLNVEHAVLNPLQPEAVPKPNQPTVEPQAQAAAPTQPAQQPIGTPRKPHPKRHVELAIQQMMAMGFKNDGGWLTQLLDSYDGNISAVLDILTPVNPTAK